MILRGPFVILRRPRARNYGDRFGLQPFRNQPEPSEELPPDTLRQESLRDFSTKTAKILEKSRAARAKTTAMTGKNRDFAPDNGKNEDPAKMTYSIPDFVSRNYSVSEEISRNIAQPREKCARNK